MTKVILITGTSTGLGASLATAAARAGHTVYATMRNLDKRGALEAAAAEAGVSLLVRPLDVEDSASVDAAVAEIMEREGRIDVLVNNAGAGFVRTLEQATMDEVAWVMNVNFHGVARCIKAVIPHMRAAGAGHVVTISSVGGLVGQPFNEIYCAAKFAVEGLMEAMASYIQPRFGIHFTLVEPGGISSEFSSRVLRRVDETGGILDDAYRPVLMEYLGALQKRRAEAGVSQTPAEVAEVVMRCIESTDPPIRTRTSTWSESLCQLKTGLDPEGRALQAKVIADFLGPSGST